MNHDLLDEGWTLTARADTLPADLPAGLAEALRTGVPARVPGTTHTELLTAGLIPDPYLDRHEQELAWMERVDWVYERRLRAPLADPDERVDLVLEGVDTIATLRLDATVLARTANQHRTYRVDLREHLRPGTQTLRVELASALAHAEAEATRLGPRPAAYTQPFNMVRKMACSFGWDWGPDLQTAGLWRPARVERWRVARLASVRSHVSVEPGGTGVVQVVVDVERSGLAGRDAPLVVACRVAGAEAVAEIPADGSGTTARLEVPHAPLWWPVGHGAQPLLDLHVELRAADPGAPAGPRGTGPVLGAWSRRIGFRTVELDTAPDEQGAAFTLRVNGRPVFVRGANWVPDDHLLTRITRERLANRLDQALGARLNLLRVWGGGIYESEDFYELCDERGLLVWQDFLLACAAYPEESPIREEIEAEAREHVARLTPHPSLVMWNGGNENLWGFRDWGWEPRLDGRTWGHWYATELLAAVVAELDPTRPYVPNSPSSPGYDIRDVHPNDPDHGSHHQWEVWNRVDYRAYREEVPRFCSEFGFQGPPTWATLQRAVRAEDGTVAGKDHPTFLLHQKAEDGTGKLDRGMAPHLGVPEDFTDWLWAGQLNQARAVRFAIEHYRSWWPATAGAIVWQLNDCWPVTSWAAVDGDGRPKPLWWAMRAAFADRLVTVQPRAGRDALVVVNDTPTMWKTTAVLERQAFDGQVLARTELPLTVGAWSAGAFPLCAPLRTPDDPTRELLVATLDRRGPVHTWLEDVNLALDPTPADVRVQPVQNGYEVEVAARSLVRDLTLLVDRLDPHATVDDALVTLLAGETATFRVRTATAVDPAALAGAPVMRRARTTSSSRPAQWRRDGRPVRPTAKAPATPPTATLAAVGSDAIGLVLARPSRLLGIEPLFMELIGGIEETLSTDGRSLLLHVVPDHQAEIAAYGRWGRDHLVDAVVLVNLVVDDPRLAVLDELAIPTVVVGGPDRELTRVAHVWIDNAQAMRDAVGYLVDLGHGVIGRVSGPATLAHTRSRTDAFLAECSGRGVRGVVVEADYGEQSGTRAARTLLGRNDPPSALVFDNDVMALAGLGVANELGLGVPGDVSLLAWDDSPLCRLAHPPLSAMSLDVHAMGVQVADAVLNLLASGRPTTSTAPLPRLVARGSTARRPH